jgi:hypothetical protein
LAYNMNCLLWNFVAGAPPVLVGPKPVRSVLTWADSGAAPSTRMLGAPYEGELQVPYQFQVEQLLAAEITDMLTRQYPVEPWMTTVANDLSAVCDGLLQLGGEMRFDPREDFERDEPESNPLSVSHHVSWLKRRWFVLVSRTNAAIDQYINFEELDADAGVWAAAQAAYAVMFDEVGDLLHFFDNCFSRGGKGPFVEHVRENVYDLEDGFNRLVGMMWPPFPPLDAVHECGFDEWLVPHMGTMVMPLRNVHDMQPGPRGWAEADEQLVELAIGKAAFDAVRSRRGSTVPSSPPTQPDMPATPPKESSAAPLGWILRLSKKNAKEAGFPRRVIVEVNGAPSIYLTHRHCQLLCELVLVGTSRCHASQARELRSNASVACGTSEELVPGSKHDVRVVADANWRQQVDLGPWKGPATAWANRDQL